MPPIRNEIFSSVVVVGSLNVDLLASVSRLPARGETVRSTGLIRRFGGKGANQALAAARQGAPVRLIGCIGADAEGMAYSEYWKSHGQSIQGIRVQRDQPTGMALITVEDGGENQIVVAPGANGSLSAAMVRVEAPQISAAAVLLAQLEVPLPAVLEAMRCANSAGAITVFNPSPSPELFPWGVRKLDVVIANEHEARKILGISAGQVKRRPDHWRGRLASHRIDSLVITRGASPTLVLRAAGLMEVPPPAVKPVDTVGAGDAFAGTLAARLAEGDDIAAAVRAANCAGALSTLKRGAQESIPTRARTDAWLSRSSTS